MEFLEHLPNGVKWIGGVLGAIGAGFLFLRQFLSGAAAERANDSGQIAAIDVWRQLAESAQAQAVSERVRADQFAKERNEAIALIGELKAQVSELTRQVDALNNQIAAMRGAIDAKS